MFTQSIIFVILLSTAWARCLLNPAYEEFQLGDIEVTVGSNGKVRSNNPFTAPDTEVVNAYNQEFRQPFVYEQNAVVLNMPGGERVIVNPGAKTTDGFPEFEDTGKLLDTLAAAELDPTTISAVLLTDADPALFAALLTPTNDAAFPEATVYIHEADHEFFTGPALLEPVGELSPEEFLKIADLYKESIAPYQAAAKFQVVADNESPITGIQFLPFKGRTGSSALKVVGGPQPNQQMLHAGGNVMSRPNQILNTKFISIYSVDPTQEVNSRLELLKMVSASKVFLFVKGEAFPGLLNIKQTGEGYDATTVQTQGDKLGKDLVKTC